MVRGHLTSQLGLWVRVHPAETEMVKNRDKNKEERNSLILGRLTLSPGPPFEPGLPGKPCKIHQMKPNEKPHSKMLITQHKCPTMVLFGHVICRPLSFPVRIFHFLIFPLSTHKTSRLKRTTRQSLSHMSGLFRAIWSYHGEQQQQS